MVSIPPSPDRTARWLDAPLLARETAGRANNVLAIRFVAAAMVILFHCYALTGRWGDEPLYAALAPMNLGALGVEVFFVLSGFLVTQSWLRNPALVPYAASRVLRIYPALVAATVFTIVVAGASSTLAWSEYLASPTTWRYFVRTASGIDVVDRLPGVFPDNPFPRAANGSLWTLPVELRLYVALALAGVAGLLARPRAWLAAALVLVIAALAWPDAVPLDPNTRGTRLAALLFLLGSLACVWQRYIPLSLPGAALAIALPLTDAHGLARDGPLFALLLAYAVLVAGYHPALRLRGIARAPDYSYGLYVYAFPIQQTIVRADPGIAPPLLFVAAFAITLVVAAISWHALEAPALRLKSRFRSRKKSR
ncbi:MAG: acyltransferase [Betaproteobacteria bacterium]